MAFFTVIAKHGAVELQYGPASGSLMQSVDILGDHGPDFPGSFQFCQFFMGGIGLCIGEEHLIPIKTKEFLRVGTIKGVT